MEVKTPRGADDQAHKKSAEAFAAGEASVAEFGVAEWADRFLGIVQEHRRAQRTERRPVLFICHSTGGIVVKQALSKKNVEGQNSLAKCCLGVTFFSTPHHGSSVLSEPEYIQTVQIHLGLKWEMSESLRHDFSLRNPDLEVSISVGQSPVLKMFDPHFSFKTPFEQATLTPGSFSRPSTIDLLSVSLESKYTATSKALTQICLYYPEMIPAVKL